MGAGRVLLWVLGCLLVIGGLVMLYFESPLNRYISMTMASIGLLIVVGLMVMGAASKARPAPRVVVNQRSLFDRPLETYEEPVGAPAVAEPERSAVGTATPTVPQARSGTTFTGVATSQRVAPDGSIVRSTVQRVVRKTPSGRTYSRKTKTVTRNRPVRAGKGRTHRRRKHVVERRNR